jgi:Tfp pilus assembly protein PilF
MNQVSNGKRTGRFPPSRALAAAFPVIITFIAFSSALSNSFTNWDDDRYVTENILVRSLSVRNIIRIFSPHTFVLANYQPITIFSFALNYAAGKLNPTGYILADLLIHLCNVLLVFLVIRKIAANDFVASLCSLLFGIHPMHVESVAWISGRKDLLYTFFFLCSILFYLSYLGRKKGAGFLPYCTACLLFIVSLLSKSSAVTMPAILFLVDYFRGRKFSKAMLVDKIPFVLPAIMSGLWAIKGQHDVGALDSTGALHIFTRIAIACYSFMFYVVRFFLPMKLSALYPYPASISRSLPREYLLSPLFAAACCGVAVALGKSKPFLFGFGFFVVNIIFILHFVPVSGSVTADRFSYMAYIGLSFVAASYIDRLLSMPRLKGKKAAIAAAIVFSLSLVSGTAVYKRCMVWKSSVALWTDVIAGYPSASAFCNRGSARLSLHEYGAAIEDLDRAVALNPGYVKAYYDAGLACQGQGDQARAIGYYSRAIGCDSGNAEAYNSRGIAYCMLGDFGRGIADYDRSLSRNPSYVQAGINRGNAYLAERNYGRAIGDYSMALDRAPAAFPQAWYNRGLAYLATGDSGRAAEDFQKACALHLDPACRLLAPR